MFAGCIISNEVRYSQRIWVKVFVVVLKASFLAGFFNMAPRAGLEPATQWLQLPKIFILAWTISLPYLKLAFQI